MGKITKGKKGLLNVTIFHILKNENYELCFSAGFFVDEIMTGKNYDRKKKILC
jgi:hypothetical protein